jgi:hypothetical protein
MIKTLSISQLQTLSHILREMEIDGVPSLPAELELMTLELRNRAAGLSALRRENHDTAQGGSPTSYNCPACGPITGGLMKVDGLLLVVCQKCRWSMIIEGLR